METPVKPKLLDFENWEYDDDWELSKTNWPPYLPCDCGHESYAWYYRAADDRQKMQNSCCGRCYMFWLRRLIQDTIGVKMPVGHVDYMVEAWNKNSGAARKPPAEEYREMIRKERLARASTRLRQARRKETRKKIKAKETQQSKKWKR